ncbi:DUF1846 domain-containing protein, partial [candidate division WOR-3 bacterium]|nr:DUF1846 domain-containing protein [candidate division WOR-3 bacterium]
MTQKIGFDSEKYLQEQSEEILKRVAHFESRLYLEFGGKLIFDYHAARVLPGFNPNAKMQLLQRLKDKVDILLCIYAGDIERRKVRADFGITYDVDTLRLIDDLREWDLPVKGVVITRFDNQPAATVFRNKLERLGVNVYTHRYTKGYPTDVDTVVSNEGYGANDYVRTDKSLVVVAGPGPGSGKLATCLSQLYHDHLQGVKSGYAKFETFPIWNLPLKHPVNVAYEAATADIRDFNMIDPFHLEAYGKTAVNYNRDVEIFPVLRRILTRIAGSSLYKSPTDMGVNRAGFGIVDDGAVREASKQEVIRRYFRCRCEYVMGFVDSETVQRVELLMEELDIKPEDRVVVMPARQAAQEAKEYGKGNAGIFCGAALELRDGTLITGKNSQLMHAASSLVLNALKYLAEIPDKIHLLSPMVISSISSLDTYFLRSKKTVSLDLEETLIALSFSATTNPAAQIALEKLKELQGCEIHMTHMPTPGDEKGLRKLGVNVTSDPNFSTNSLAI